MEGSFGGRIRQAVQARMGAQPGQGGPPSGGPPPGMADRMKQFSQQGRDPMGNLGAMMRAATMLRNK